MHTTTATDVEDGAELDLVLQVLAVERRPEHPAVSRSVHCRDVAGTPVVLDEFEDAPLDADRMAPGGWYAFEGVVGDVGDGGVSVASGDDTSVRRVGASGAVSAPAGETPAPLRADGGRSEPPETSDCPECGATVTLRLSADDAREGGDLTAADLDDGTFFACPVCQVAWDHTDRQPHDFPLMSAGPGGTLTEQSAGYGLEQQYTSTFRLLGYRDGSLMLRDVGEMPFANADGLASPELLEEQLGEVIAVQGEGYPSSVQRTLNALRTAYCVRATVGRADPEGRYEVDADEPVEIVEAVPVDYVLDADEAPSLADRIWQDARDELMPNGDRPQVRQAIHRDGGPEGDVYVFVRGLEVDGMPLLSAMQKGVTEHLEKFTTNFTGGFSGDVADVIFVVPSDRPYFAVYVLGEECLDLAHDLRSTYGLPPAHRGWTTNTAAPTPVRYDPRYIEEGTVDGDPGLLAAGDRRGALNLATGEPSGPDLTVTPRPNDLVVELEVDGTSTEVARVRPPSARL